MTKAKTNAENQAAFKAKKRAEGLVYFNAWIKKKVLSDVKKLAILNGLNNDEQFNRLLEKGLEFLNLMKEDSDKLAASDANELMRCWENVHRMWQAESHIRTIIFREETRWPGYYSRTDFPDMKADWEVFANCKWDPETGE